MLFITEEISGGLVEMGDDGGESGCEGPTGAATRPGEGPGPGCHAPSGANAPSGRGRRSRRGKKGDVVAGGAGGKDSECSAPNLADQKRVGSSDAEDPEPRSGPAGESAGGSVPDISPREGPADCVSKVPQLFVLKVFDSSAEVEVRHASGEEDGGGASEVGGAAAHRSQDQVQIKLNGQVQAGQKASAAQQGTVRATVPLPTVAEGRTHRIEARVRRGARGAWSAWSSAAEIACPPAPFPEDERRVSKDLFSIKGTCDAAVQTEEWHTADAASGAGVETSSPTFDHQTISSQTHVSLPSQIPVSIFARCSAEENQPHFDQEVS